MLKDIDFKKVTEVAMAVIPETIEGEMVWNAYLINLSNENIESVLVNSRGFGEIKGKPTKTSQLRQFFEEIPPQSAIKVEEILKELLSLSNEFWVSFSKGSYLFDKKYVFVPETLTMNNLVKVPILEKEGVLII